MGCGASSPATDPVSVPAANKSADIANPPAVEAPRAATEAATTQANQGVKVCPVENKHSEPVSPPADSSQQVSQPEASTNSISAPLEAVAGVASFSATREPDAYIHQNTEPQISSGGDSADDDVSQAARLLPPPDDDTEEQEMESHSEFVAAPSMGHDDGVEAPSHDEDQYDEHEQVSLEAPLNMSCAIEGPEDLSHEEEKELAEAIYAHVDLNSSDADLEAAAAALDGIMSDDDNHAKSP